MKLDILKSVVNIGINTQGKDYVVGDVHGMYYKLLNKLDSFGFDTSKDRLFSVGDIIDRGPDSLKCVELLDEPWFYAVRGNHEQVAIDYFKSQITTYEYQRWGGKWFIDLDVPQQQTISSILDKLPWVIQVKTINGVVGIVHSQPVKIDGEYNWQNFIHAIKHNLPLQNFDDDVRNVCTWSRRIAYNEDELKKSISGVFAVVAGHTTIPEVLNQYNFYSIDTGTCFEIDGYGNFTVLNLSTMEVV